MATFKGHMATITHMCSFGGHLLSVGRDSVLKIWDWSQCSVLASKEECKQLEAIGEISFGESFHVTCMVHLSHTSPNAVDY